MGRLGILVAALLMMLNGCRPSRAAQSAGQVGCRPSEITISDETVADDGFWEASENWVAECNGRRFICTENSQRHSAVVDNKSVMWRDSDVSCKEEYSGSTSPSAFSGAAPAGPTHEPPSSGGGLAFGTDAEAAQSACEAAGHQWQMLSPSQASCSEAVTSIGVPTRVELGLCGGKVCRITLVHEPERAWLNVIGELRSKLESKYGPPGTRRGEVPEDCQSGDAFVSCLKTQRVRLRYGWSWGSGQSVTLLIGVPPEGGVPAIRITYAGNSASGKVNESAL